MQRVSEEELCQILPGGDKLEKLCDILLQFGGVKLYLMHKALDQRSRELSELMISPIPEHLELEPPSSVPIGSVA